VNVPTTRLVRLVTRAGFRKLFIDNLPGIAVHEYNGSSGSNDGNLL
jgi:hypothetical protein